ncbi:MAG: CRISPR-associated endonuclease Cas2 [Candidatus Pacearchaeota archaeon]
MVKIYVIIVYDVSIERVTKICQFLRKYLDWIQNSVFEGELTESQLKEIETKIKSIINEESDCVQIYSFRTIEMVNKLTIGKPKSNQETVI